MSGPDLRVLGHLFREGIDTCPACGAAITWNKSPDGSSVEILHPYDPKIGPPCKPFKVFCDSLQQRAREQQPSLGLHDLMPEAWQPVCGSCGHRFPNGPGQYCGDCPECGAAWDGSEL